MLLYKGTRSVDDLYITTFDTVERLERRWPAPAAQTPELSIRNNLLDDFVVVGPFRLPNLRGHASHAFVAMISAGTLMVCMIVGVHIGAPLCSLFAAVPIPLQLRSRSGVYASLPSWLLAIGIQVVALPIIACALSFDFLGALVHSSAYLGVPIGPLAALAILTILLWSAWAMWLTARCSRSASAPLGLCPCCRYTIDSPFCPECGWGRLRHVGAPRVLWRAGMVLTLCSTLAGWTGLAVVRSCWDDDTSSLRLAFARTKVATINPQSGGYLLQTANAQLLVLAWKEPSPQLNVYARRTTAEPFTLIGDFLTIPIGTSISPPTMPEVRVARAGRQIGSYPSLWIYSPVSSLERLQLDEAQRRFGSLSQ